MFGATHVPFTIVWDSKSFYVLLSWLPALIKNSIFPFWTMKATSSFVLPSITDTILYIQINKHPEDMFCVLLADFGGTLSTNG